MRTVLGSALTALVFCGALSADDKKDQKIDAKKLIGLWELKEKKEEQVTKTVFEFAKDGRVGAVNILSGIEGGKIEGTYKLDGSKLTLTMKVEGKEVVLTRTVTKLTDTELVTTDEKGKEFAFFRPKDK
jgi:uncharacterized protein (TIGR03066 family)